MKIALKVKETRIDYGKILRKRGLGDDNQARIFLANTVARFCDPYVPMDTGTLKNTKRIKNQGHQLVYPAPYAQTMYNGVSKHGFPFHYQGAPMRGKEWDKRMMADYSKDVVRSLASYVGGRPK